jgi:hypothetical protein
MHKESATNPINTMKRIMTILTVVPFFVSTVAFAQADVAGIVSEIQGNPNDLESIVAMAVADNPNQAFEIVGGALEALPHQADRIVGASIAGLQDKTPENVREIVRLAVIANPAGADDIHNAAGAAAPQQTAAIEEGLIAGMESAGPRPRQPGPAAPVSPEVFSPEELERDWPLADQYLVEGRLAEGIAALQARLEEAPADDQARFGLGVMQFLHGVERLGNSLHRYGSGGGTLAREMQMLPILRMPVPLNPEPETIDVEAFRAIFQQFHDDLAAAEATLAGIESDDVQLPLRFGRIQLNLMGPEGHERQPLWRIYSQITGMQVREPEAQQFVIDFDIGDAYWLRGYCNLLMATQQMVLAHELDEIFERTAHLLFPDVDTPHTFLLERTADAGEFGGFDILPILDGIAMIHLLNLPVAEPERMQAALAHFENVIELSRTSWEHILAEEDNRNEWIPNPNQTGVLPGVEVTSEMVAGWMQFLDELESILAGDTLAPFWRTGRENVGINIRRVFTEPTPLDIVLWIQGTAATPYLEEGKVTEPDFWWRLQETFNGQFIAYAIWLN